jgi:glutathione S-transferase
MIVAPQTRELHVLKIYGVPISVHTRKVIVVANLKGLPYEIIPVVPVVPGNPPPNWRELSPTRRIPAITDGDFTVADSTAICMYLDRAYPEHPIYPSSARELAQVLSTEMYATEQLFRNVVGPLFHEVFIHPRIQSRPTDHGTIDHVFNEVIPEVFGHLDRLAGDGFLVGRTITAADLAVVSNLITYRYCGFDLDRHQFGRLANYFDRMVRTSSIRRSLLNEKSIVKSMGLNDEILEAVLA